MITPREEPARRLSADIARSMTLSDRDGVYVDGRLLPFAVGQDFEVTYEPGWTIVMLPVPVIGVVKIVTGKAVQELLPEGYWENRERRSIQVYEAKVAEARQGAKRFLMLKVIGVRHELGLDPSDFVGRP